MSNRVLHSVSPCLTGRFGKEQSGIDFEKSASGFAIPPRTAADPIYAQNWAYATLEFAEAIGSPERFDEALKRASSHADLATPIATARGIRLAGDDTADVSLTSSESLEDFYSRLGWRIARLPSLDEHGRAALIDGLLERSLQHGPRWPDLGIVSAALSNGVQLDPERDDLVKYERRLARDSEMRNAFSPYIKALCRKR